ncbi:hypothetical protein V6Z11_A11G136700 [Gossypium hirsutum]
MPCGICTSVAITTNSWLQSRGRYKLYIVIPDVRGISLPHLKLNA